MKKTTLIIILFCLGIFPSLSFSEISMEFKENSKVDGPYITLGEIADIKTEDIILFDKIKNIELGYAPPPGISKTITTNYIKIKIRQNGIDPEKILSSYPEKVIVTSEYNEVKGEEIITKAKEYLSSKIKHIENICIISSQTIPSILTPKGNIELVPQGNVPSVIYGPLNIIVNINVNGDIYQKVRIILDVKIIEDVVITQNNLKKGEILSKESVSIVKKTITPAEKDTLFNKIDDVLGQELIAHIGSNTAISKNMIRKPYIVKKGDRVKIILDAPFMSLNTVGNVMESGMSGEIIKVKNADSGKIILGKIVNSQTLVVEMK